MNKINLLWSTLRSRFWFLPSLMIMGSMVFAFGGPRDGINGWRGVPVWSCLMTEQGVAEILKEKDMPQANF